MTPKKLVEMSRVTEIIPFHYSSLPLQPWLIPNIILDSIRSQKRDGLLMNSFKLECFMAGMYNS